MMMLVLIGFSTLSQSLRIHKKTGESVTEHLIDREQVLTHWNQEIDWSAVDESVEDFVHWRFANHTSDATLSAIKLQQPQEKDLEKCMKVVKPLSESNKTSGKIALMGGKVPRMFFTDDRVTDFIDTVDHIYYICMNCHRRVPNKLSKKASFINGAKSDECLHVEGHWSKVTAAHRLAVLHAKQNNYKTVLMLEEDAVFDVDSSKFDFESIAKFIHDDTKEWKMMRINWYDQEGAADECKKSKKCTQWVEQKGMCTGKFKHKFHSSAGYIIPERSYDKFLNRGTSIDGDVLGQFAQTLLTPPLVHQSGFRAQELAKEGPFMNLCKA